MKKTVFLLCLLSTTAAFAQYGVSTISNQPQSYQFSSHPEHAAYAPMSSGQSVVGGSNYSSAQGERPASDFPQSRAVWVN